MKFKNIQKIAIIVLFSAAILIETKISSRFRARERTLFGMLNGPGFEPVNMNETKFPPFENSCKPNVTNTTDEQAFFQAPNITITNITQPLIILPTPTPKCNPDWNYLGHGGDWECTCIDGNEQSPIDLPGKDNATPSPVRPVMNYELISASDNVSTVDKMNTVISGTSEDDTLKIRYHNGAIKIIHPNLGKLVKLDGSVYEAEEIQFHTPSEHTIQGKRFEMEMHVIHYGKTQGDIAKQVVLSFLFTKSPGKYNKFIDSLDFYSLPNPTDNYRELLNDIYIPNIFYSSDDDQIPVIKPFSFYTYDGSLTFPPCTERTTYFVVADPIELSSTALSLFQEALRKPDRIDERGNLVIESSATPQNNRDTQPLNDREVFIYDHTKYDCPTFAAKPKRVKPAGHYEKRMVDATQFVYIQGSDPSGIPGAFVVTEAEAKNLPEKEETS